MFASVMLLSFVLPGWDRLLALRLELGEREAAREQVEALVEQGQNFLARQDALQDEINRLRSALPVSPQVPELIAALNVLAMENNVTLSDLRFELAPYRPEAGVAAAELPVSRVVIRVSAGASYGQLKSWLRGVESELRLMHVNVLNLRPVLGGVEARDNMPISAEITMVAYWQPILRIENLPVN